MTGSRGRRSATTTALLAALLCALGTAAAAQQGLVGTWLMRTPEVELTLELKANGRFARSVRSEGQQEQLFGGYRTTANQLVFSADGGGSMTFSYRLAGDVLELLADDGTGMQLARRTAAEQGGHPAGEGNGPAAGPLNDAVPAEIQKLATNLVKPLEHPTARPPGIKVPGWKTASLITGWFLYPPSWSLKQSPDRSGVQLTAPGGATNLWFAAMDILPGNPTPEQMLAMLLARTAGQVPVRILTNAVRAGVVAVRDDSGQEHLWTGRWLSPQGTKMFFCLSVLVLARGTRTPVTWSMQACPEAKAVTTWKDTFSVIQKTQVFPPPGGSHTRPDRDQDGIPDDDDADPDDPNVK